MNKIRERLLTAIENRPGLTERELAELLYGSDKGYQQLVNWPLRQMVREGLVKRQGRGGLSDPFRYILD